MAAGEFAVNGILFRVRIAVLEYSISGGSVGGINAACRVLYNRVLIWLSWSAPRASCARLPISISSCYTVRVSSILRTFRTMLPMIYLSMAGKLVNGMGWLRKIRDTGCWSKTTNLILRTFGHFRTNYIYLTLNAKYEASPVGVRDFSIPFTLQILFVC